MSCTTLSAPCCAAVAAAGAAAAAANPILFRSERSYFQNAVDTSSISSTSAWLTELPLPMTSSLLYIHPRRELAVDQGGRNALPLSRKIEV